MFEEFNGKMLHQLLSHAAIYVNYYRLSLNEMNVFPVADGDTGNNVCATLSAIPDLASPGNTARETFEKIADAMLMAARGNSGLILTEYFNSLAQHCPAKINLTPVLFIELATKAATAAKQAIENPVEGTIISLLSALPKICRAHYSPQDSFLSLLQKSLPFLQQIVADTPRHLKVLAAHHTVDAGAQAFYYFVEGWLHAMQNFTEAAKPVISATMTENSGVHQLTQPPDYRYCTEAIFTLGEKSRENFMKQLQNYGNSIVVSGRQRRYRAHLHTNKPIELFSELAADYSFKYPKVDDMLKQYQAAQQPLAPIALVTDSSLDLPAALLDQEQIHIIPATIMMDDCVYLDRLSIDSKNFYAKLNTVQRYPTTAIPDIKSIQNLFQFLQAHYQAIIVITVSKQLSGLYHLICKVAQGFPKVHVVNSRRNSGAQGLLVKYAASLIRQELPLQTILQKITLEIPRIKIWVAVDNFRAMIRSGRVSKISGTLADWIRLKPVIGLDEEGNGMIVAKTFNSEKTLARIQKLIQEQHAKHPITDYCILHADALAKTAVLTEMAQAIIGKSPAYITEVSPSIGLHAGFGCIAIATHSASG